MASPGSPKEEPSTSLPTIGGSASPTSTGTSPLLPGSPKEEPVSYAARRSTSASLLGGASSSPISNSSNISYGAIGSPPFRARDEYVSLGEEEEEVHTDSESTKVVAAAAAKLFSKKNHYDEDEESNDDSRSERGSSSGPRRSSLRRSTTKNEDFEMRSVTDAEDPELGLGSASYRGGSSSSRGPRASHAVSFSVDVGGHQGKEGARVRKNLRPRRNLPGIENIYNSTMSYRAAGESASYLPPTMTDFMPLFKGEEDLYDGKVDTGITMEMDESIAEVLEEKARIERGGWFSSLPNSFTRTLKWCLRSGLAVAAAVLIALLPGIINVISEYYLLPVTAIFVSSPTMGATVRTAVHASLGGCVGSLISVPFALLLHKQNDLLKALSVLLITFFINYVDQPPMWRKFATLLILVNFLVDSPFVGEEDDLNFGKCIRFSSSTALAVMLGSIIAVTPHIVPFLGTFATYELRDGVQNLISASSAILASLVDCFCLASEELQDDTEKLIRRNALDLALGRSNMLLQLANEERLRLIGLLPDLEWEPYNWLVLTNTSKSDRAALIRGQISFAAVMLEHLKQLHLSVERMPENKLRAKLFPFIQSPLLSLRYQLVAQLAGTGPNQSPQDVSLFAQQSLEEHPLGELLSAYYKGRQYIFIDSGMFGRGEVPVTEHFPVDDALSFNFFLMNIISCARLCETLANPGAEIPAPAKPKDPAPEPIVKKLSFTDKVEAFLQRRYDIWKESVATHRFQGAVQFAVAAVIVCVFALIPVLRSHTVLHYWAPVTVALVMERGTGGGSFRLSLLRLQGAVLGQFFGYLVLMLTDNSYVIACSLLVWVSITTYPRSCPDITVSWTVAGMGAALTSLGVRSTTATFQKLLFDRLEQTVLGVSIVVLVTMTWPERASDHLQLTIIKALSEGKQCLVLLYEAYINSDVEREGEDVLISHRHLSELQAEASVAQKLPKMRALITKSMPLLGEAGLEPQMWRPPFDQKGHTRVWKAVERLTSTLELTLRILQWRSRNEDGMLLKAVRTTQLLEQDTRLEGTGVLLTPLRPALKSIELEIYEMMDSLHKAFSDTRPEFRVAITGRGLKSDELLTPLRNQIMEAVESMYATFIRTGHGPLSNRDNLTFYSLVECFIQLVMRVEELTDASLQLFQKEVFVSAHRNFY